MTAVTAAFIWETVRHDEHLTEGDVIHLGQAYIREHVGTGNGGWRVVIDRRASKRFGQCRFSKREIGVTAAYIRNASPAQVRNTLLHEIAHVLAGPGHGHDGIWKYTFRRIGGDPRMDRTDAARAMAKYVATCPCGKQATRQRKPTATGYTFNGCGHPVNWVAVAG